MLQFCHGTGSPFFLQAASKQMSKALKLFKCFFAFGRTSIGFSKVRFPGLELAPRIQKARTVQHMLETRVSRGVFLWVTGHPLFMSKQQGKRSLLETFRVLNKLPLIFVALALGESPEISGIQIPTIIFLRQKVFWHWWPQRLSPKRRIDHESEIVC